ncbi:hypothetical protein RN001_008639 [Aquatica leii]|uniref:Ninjurin-1 n=1 Tax=Aquatica leii TaxID=1421715 RepID=A0AAN7PAZ8_9COLE|nr:hypothetical protein RN001_008639 [Aquatica leii]
MSTITTSPINNTHLRSRSPSPGTHTAQNNDTAKSNFLKPENSNLYKARRSATPDSSARNTTETIPLIDAGTGGAPPLANPEVDDNFDDREVVNRPYPGVDDGFFSNNDGPNIFLSDRAGGIDDVDVVDAVDKRRVTPKPPLTPTDTTTHRHFPDIEHGFIPTDLESIPDINLYQHKKTLAQGMMDLALFSANANQLRYVLESDRHPYYYPGVILISISLLLQVAIGVGLIWNSRYNVKDDKEICIANKISNFTIMGIFLVTVVNVFISAFGVASVQPVAATTP